MTGNRGQDAEYERIIKITENILFTMPSMLYGENVHIFIYLPVIEHSPIYFTFIQSKLESLSL